VGTGWTDHSGVRATSCRRESKEKALGNTRLLTSLTSAAESVKADDRQAQLRGPAAAAPGWGGLTQEALAELAGLSLREVSDLELGARRAPYRESVLRLAEVLGLAEPERETLLAASRRWRAAIEAALPTRIRTGPHAVRGTVLDLGGGFEAPLRWKRGWVAAKQPAAGARATITGLQPSDRGDDCSIRLGRTSDARNASHARV
jgi:transcriptional regulator with XRE-family HTH domain